LGATVIAAAGSAEKLEVAQRYGGADHVVDYSKPKWQDQVLALTKGKGVNGGLDFSSCPDLIYLISHCSRL